jgi:hypothetical protein
VPLPSVATDEDDKQFAKRFLKCHTYEEVIRHAIIPPSSRKGAVFEGDLLHLRQARQCVVELFLAFFKSLGSSLTHLERGIEVFTFTSEDCEELFICVRMSDELSVALAQMGDYSVQLSPACLDNLHIKITDQSMLVPAFVNFEPHLLEDSLLRTYEKPDKPGEFVTLRTVDSMRLLYDKITDYIDLHELIRMGLLNSWYLAHNKDNLSFFHQHWANFRKICWPDQPIDEIRDYFGEGVAFYFLFLGFLSKGLLALMPMSIVCSVCWVLKYDNLAQVLFCLLMFVWSTVLLKMWRRTESYYATKWGTDRRDVKERVKDPVNPDFHGHKKPSPLDENIMELQADPKLRFLGRIVSACVTTVVVFMVIVGVGLNQWYAAKENDKGNKSAGVLAAGLLSLQIKFWDKTWDNIIVDPLNSLEQHITQWSYDQNRVAKTLIFKFINTFYAFFYIAYVQQILDPSGCAGSCKEYLVEQLAMVFATYISFGLMDMGLPYAVLKFKIWREEREARQHEHEVFKLSMLEQQSKMNEYKGQDEDADYMSSLFPVAFVMLFGTVMPASVVLAFFALSIQIRTHAWNLTKVSQRPFPVRTGSIGIWDTWMNLLCYGSAFNTIGLMVTQVDDVCSFIPGFWRLTDFMAISRNGPGAQLILFFLLQNVAIILKLTVDHIIPDLTDVTATERLRQEMQRIRVQERGIVEIHESISIRCSLDVERSAYEKRPPLRPGDPMYDEPFV